MRTKRPELDTRPGPTVLVTGASSGIGAATVRRFAVAGWRVVATMRSPDRQPPDKDGAALRLRLDVTDDASVRAAMDEVLDRLGQIDVLVNNAGYGLVGPMEAYEDEDLRRQFETNVLGVFRTTRAVIPHMRGRGNGTIVMVSSIGGRLTTPLTSAYNATKWAVEGLSESVRYELAPFGVRVKVVEPGGIATDFGGRSMATVTAEPYQAMTDALMKRYAARPLPGPEKVADIILQAATDTSGRLRYLVHHQPLWALRRFLPDLIWRRLMAKLIGN